MKANSFYGTGRRKSSIARVWLFPEQKGFLINGKTMPEYLQRKSLQAIANMPLSKLDLLNRFRISVNVCGGGPAGQAGAISLGISRALLGYKEELRSSLRVNGFLTRDPREKERKKPGRRGARKRFQFTKR